MKAWVPQAVQKTPLTKMSGFKVICLVCDGPQSGLQILGVLGLLFAPVCFTFFLLLQSQVSRAGNAWGALAVLRHSLSSGASSKIRPISWDWQGKFPNSNPTSSVLCALDLGRESCYWALARKSPCRRVESGFLLCGEILAFWISIALCSGLPACRWPGYVSALPKLSSFCSSPQPTETWGEPSNPARDSCDLQEGPACWLQQWS